MAEHQISRDRLELLMRLEEIMSCCCNDYMQNYGSSKGYEGNGRKSDFPATFVKSGKQAQNWSLLTGGEIEESVIMSGVYKFGASQIPVYRNLSELLEYLETHYGLKIPK